MFPEWTWIVGLWLGAVVGSFLNVVIYRTPRSLSLYSPSKSFCPRCKHSLGIPDLVPLLSWVFLRGKCRHCGAQVSSRYFFVELLNGAIWAGIWYQYFIVSEQPGKAIAYALAASALVAIIFIDWELFIIPDQINAFLAATGVCYNIYLYAIGSPLAETWGMPSSLAGWLVGVAALWGIAFLGRVLFGKDAMGHGDIKMARGIGAVLFPTMALMSFGLAVFVGAILGIVQILARRGQAPQPPAEVLRASNGTELKVAEEVEEDYQPETFGSLIKCGIGYLLGVDILGLFAPRISIAWFGESPYEPIEELDDFKPDLTTIPFGPYLALGAIVATIFSAELVQGLDAYMKSMSGR
ncbi:MAG TPA: prepilin peptidase [Fimbriimonadaceae bacterium]|nr:prepilin peptidase [Fimbriimonadaceae bacterium]